MKQKINFFFILIALLLLSHAQAQTIITVAGNGNNTGIFTNNVSATATEVPVLGIAADDTGNIYLADAHQIRKVSKNTGIIIAITAGGPYNGDNIPATAAAIEVPYYVALDSHDNIFISDEGNYRVRKVAAATGLIATVAGTGTTGYNGDGIQATDAQVGAIDGVCLDTAGNLYIGDVARLRRVDALTGIITTIAGTGTGGYSGDGGPATAAQIAGFRNITADMNGDIYAACTNGHCIRKVAAATGIITTVAGTGLPGYNGDSIAATAAQLHSPTGLAVRGGALFFTDDANNRVRRIDLATGIITTIAGTGVFSYNGDCIAADTAQLAYPWGLAIDTAGHLYFGDGGNYRIRELINTPAIGITASPPGVNIYMGQQVIFTATVASPGASPAFQWYRNSQPVAGATANPYTTTALANNDTITCRLVSAVICPGYDTALSNKEVIHITSNTGTVTGSNWRVFPNPAKGVVSVSGASGEFIITDMAGREIMTKEVSKGKEDIDISRLAGGLYLYRIMDNGVIVTEGKLVKE